MEWIHVFTIIGVVVSVLVALLIPIYKILTNHIHDTDTKIDSLRDELRVFKVETNQKFEKIDQRFERIDQRFEGIDRKFEGIDQRFEKINQRLENEFKEMSRRFDVVNQRLDTVISLTSRNQKA